MVNMHKVLLIACIFLYGLMGANAEDLPRPPERPHLIIDVNSGEVLSEEKAFVRWAPASLTKLMTSYTVLRTLQLQHLAMNSPVRISEAALAQPPSKMGFPIGTILTIEAALQIIMVKSANDVSVALGEAVAGSEENFVLLMNGHARRLGMSDTHFVNTHGLHEPKQFTNARDMAVLSLAIIQEFPQYEALYRIPAIRIANRRLRNHNALLARYPGTIGMKTGYVCASGFNVVVRTKRDGRELLAIVLGGSSSLARNVRAARLLTEAFSEKQKRTETRLKSLEKPKNVSDVPEDITLELCPGKYAYNARPAARPLDAPKAPEPAAVDIVLDEAKLEELAAREPKITIPKVSPSPPELPLEDVEIDQPQTLRQLADIYLTPRKGSDADVLLTLGGAVGPNPNGIKHTDGGPYVPPIPVPKRSPYVKSENLPLDLRKTSE